MLTAAKHPGHHPESTFPIHWYNRTTGWEPRHPRIHCTGNQPEINAPGRMHMLLYLRSYTSLAHHLHVQLSLQGSLNYTRCQCVQFRFRAAAVVCRARGLVAEGVPAVPVPVPMLPGGQILAADPPTTTLCACSGVGQSRGVRQTGPALRSRTSLRS